jgi:hypothetical protein
LRRFGFNRDFIKWVISCIKNPWIAPLIKGWPTYFFKASRGLDQGCPLSPLLYVMMVETLNRRLEWEKSSGKIPRLWITRGVKRINHSQFVDDTLLLGGASKVTAFSFKNILD